MLEKNIKFQTEQQAFVVTIKSDHFLCGISITRQDTKPVSQEVHITQF